MEIYRFTIMDLWASCVFRLIAFFDILTDNLVAGAGKTILWYVRSMLILNVAEFHVIGKFYNC